MKEELNIAAILKDKPLDTKLWTDMFGEVALDYVSKYGNGFNVKHHKGVLDKFLPNGKFYEEGTLCIYPSRNMRDWSKFAWKKGDVLTTKTGSLTVVFDYFNTEYMSFAGKYSFCSYQEEKEDDQWKKDGENSYKTNCFHKVSDDEAKEFIEKIEEHYGGKLNLETLEIEKQPEFKDGDIVAMTYQGRTDIAILKEYCAKYINVYTVLTNAKSLFLDRQFRKNNVTLRPATDSEKQQLFDALAKEGKKWNPDTKQIEDLSKKCEFKAFDKVLARFEEELEWMPDFFYYYDNTDKEMPYVCIANGRAVQCIPYNDQTKHLLGTTDEWKGGEG